MCVFVDDSLQKHMENYILHIPQIPTCLFSVNIKIKRFKNIIDVLFCCCFLLVFF